jgi:hypothetical protein
MADACSLYRSNGFPGLYVHASRPCKSQRSSPCVSQLRLALRMAAYAAVAIKEKGSSELSSAAGGHASIPAATVSPVMTGGIHVTLGCEACMLLKLACRSCSRGGLQAGPVTRVHTLLDFGLWTLNFGLWTLDCW